jgi:hypothetical protein
VASYKMYGKYRGEVVSIKDPEKSGRVQAKLLSDEDAGDLDWADPNFMPNHFFLPKVGDQVWIEFAEGDIENPIWTGYIPTQAQVKILNPTYDLNASIISGKKVSVIGEDTIINGTKSTLIKSIKDKTVIEGNTKLDLL